MYVVSLFSHFVPDQAEVLLNLKSINPVVLYACVYMYNNNKYYGDDVNMLRNRGRFSGQNSRKEFINKDFYLPAYQQKLSIITK